MVDDKNTRAAQRLDELGLTGFPTTYFDAGYGEVSGGTSSLPPYTNQILYAGARPVNTEVVDLTVSMNWLGGQGSSADDFEATITINILPGMSFAYPDGIPETIIPEQETTVSVNVAGTGIGIPVSGTGQLHFSIDSSPYISVGMVETLPNEYEAVLPALSCDESLDYYFSAEEQSVGIINNHDASPFHSITVNVFDTVFADDFESDLGWVKSGGTWARGTPNGLGGSHGYPDPTSGHSGSNVLGYNLNGDYTNSMPQYHMTSPAFDCSGKDNTQLRFWRWLGVEEPAYDHAYIRISTNGSTWYTVWENDRTIEDNSWSEQIIDISSYADNQATVYVRFTMGISDADWVFCGWNIDDIAVVGRNCDYTGLTISTSSIPDWTEGHPYSQTLNCINQNGNITWIDRYGGLVGTGLSLSTDGLVSGTPAAAGDVYFFAQATDETPNTTDKLYTLTINPAVDITTTALGDGTQGEAYSTQLESSGGTGSITWTDLNGDLSGTGLALSASGLLSGTPSTDDLISFTAVATDDVGASDQQALTISVSCCHLRGDVAEPKDGSVLVNDIVLLVNYIFKSGSAPTCLDEGDCAVPIDGVILVNDIVYLVNYLFKSGAVPPAC